MKKLLTILLALLVVTGVVFAEGDPPAPLVPDGDIATLTLKSSVGGEFSHGFTKNLDEGYTLGNTVYENVEVTLTSNAQELGYYVVKTNASVQFGVSFAVNPMTNVAETVYVPYSLKFTYASQGQEGTRTYLNGDTNWGTGGSFLIKPKEEGSWSWSEDIDEYSTVTETVIGKGSLGSGTLALSLEADFGTSNDNANLPEGDYVGTVVATITTN